jgi:hypothetical protein
MGGWAVAQSPILGTTIMVERLAKRRYESLFSYYEKVSPKILMRSPDSSGWCERRSSLASVSEAVYSIIGRFPPSPFVSVRTIVSVDEEAFIKPVN